MVLGLLHVVYL